MSTGTGDLQVRTWTARAELGVERGPDRATWIAVGLAAAGADLAVRSGVAVLAGAALVAVVAAALLAGGRLVTPHSRLLALAAAVFGACLAVRTSPWLGPFDVLAAAGLLVLACSLARDGDALDLTIPGLVARGAHALAHGLAGPAFVLAGRRAGRTLPVVRGLLLAAPVAAVLGVLLASADPVFASLFDLPTDPGEVLLHAALMGMGAWGMAGLVRLASARPGPALPPSRSRLGRTEAATVVGALVVLYGAFAGSQLVALAGGGDHVIGTAGLTYAEYARSGFFQLLAAAALTLGVLLGLRAVTAGDRRFVLLTEAAVVLTLVIVAVALRRLALYEQAFGLTMLRLYSAAFAVWIGAVFVMLGVSLAGVGRRRAWLVPAALATALAGLLGLNVVNPEAVVVRRNVARAEATGRFDPAYLAGLSDDAVPALVDGLPRLDPAARAEVTAMLCEAGSSRPTARGWWAYNAAADGAREARNRLCGG